MSTSPRNDCSAVNYLLTTREAFTMMSRLTSATSVDLSSVEENIRDLRSE